jgi:hypothetical protein
MSDDDGFFLGEFDSERQAALAYDRAMLIVDPDTPREDLNFDPDESEHVTFPPETLRQLHAMRDGNGRIN